MPATTRGAGPPALSAAFVMRGRTCSEMARSSAIHSRVPFVRSPAIWSITGPSAASSTEVGATSVMSSGFAGDLFDLASGNEARRVVRVAGVEAAAPTHERGGAPADTPAVGSTDVLIVVPGEAHLVGFLVDEHEVLDAGRGVTVEVDDRHIADVLPGRCALQQRGEVVECVRRPEGVVDPVSREHLQPAVLLLRGRERQIARRDLLDIEQIGYLVLIHSLSSIVTLGDPAGVHADHLSGDVASFVRA